jgi:hypothetical protein
VSAFTDGDRSDTPDALNAATLYTYTLASDTGLCVNDVNGPSYTSVEFAYSRYEADGTAAHDTSTRGGVNPGVATRFDGAAGAVNPSAGPASVDDKPVASTATSRYTYVVPGANPVSTKDNCVAGMVEDTTTPLRDKR